MHNQVLPFAALSVTEYLLPHPHAPPSRPRLTIQTFLDAYNFLTQFQGHICRTPGLNVKCVRLERRRPIIKKRQLTRRQKLKAPLKDAVRRLNLNPESPEFEGRLRTEITSVVGPNMLEKIVQDWGQYLSPRNHSFVLSMLAGFVTDRQKLTGALEISFNDAPPSSFLMRRLGAAVRSLAGQFRTDCYRPTTCVRKIPKAVIPTIEFFSWVQQALVRLS